MCVFAVCLLASLDRPARADAALDRAIDAFDAGQYEEAYTQLDALSRKRPNSAEIHFYRGLTAARLSRSDESIEAYRKAEAIDPTFPSLQTSIGLALFRDRRFDESGTHFERAIAQDPNDGSAYLFLGLTHQEQGRWTESLADFRSCRIADPELSSIAWFNTGRSHIALGNRIEAHAALELALELEPEGEMHASIESLLGSLSGSSGLSRSWWLVGGIGVEYDDELTVTEVDVVTNRSDTAGVFDISVGMLFPEWKRIEFETGYDFYQSVYDETTQLNLQSHSPHISASTSVYGVMPTASYYYTYSSLDGNDFFDLHRVRLGVSRLARSWWYATVAWEIQDRDFANQSDRDAVRNGFLIENLFFLFDRRFTGILNWRVEDENSNASEFDYVGNVLRMEIRGPLVIEGYEGRFEFGYEFSNRDYQHTTQSIGKKRHDWRHTFRMRFRAPIVRHVDGVFDYIHIDSNSNLPSQEYNENIVTFKAEFAF